MLQKRVAEIALINVDRIPKDRAGFGSTLHVIDGHGEKLVFQLVMPEDADATKGLISTTSPIGRALLEQGAGRRGQGRHARRHRANSRSPSSSPSTTKPTDDDRFDAPGRPSSASDSYSPQRRTALVLTGTGTAAPITPACCARCTRPASRSTSSPAAASARSARCSPRSTARSGCGTRKASGDRRRCERCTAGAPSPQIVGWSLAASVAIVAVPIAAVAVGLIVFPIDFVLKMVGAGGACGSRRGVSALRANRRLRPMRCRPGCRGWWCSCSAARRWLRRSSGWFDAPRRGRGRARGGVRCARRCRRGPPSTAAGA